MFSCREGLANPCPQCGARAWGIGTATTASGSTVHPYYCRGCGTKTQLYEKKEVAKQLGCESQLEIRIYKQRQCVVCGAIGAELHHFAPFHLFGSDSGRWPTAYLCVPCHVRWHQLVTPHMGKRKEAS